MYPNSGANDKLHLRPNFRLIGCRCRVVLDWIDLATDYKIVLHLLFPEAEVRTVELSNAHLG
jgi:hypothetical protein